MNNSIKMLSSNIKNIMESHQELKNIFEIRLRMNSPLYVKTTDGNYFVTLNLKSQKPSPEFYQIKKQDIDETIANLTMNSIHAFEREMQGGYITIEGGHRVGLSGDCVYGKNDFVGFKNITSLNIRIARSFKGCCEKYLKYFIESDNKIYNTLVVGPPLSGKTTFIRDLTAYFSDGSSNPRFSGCDVTVIDERGEISSVYNGVPQMYVGYRTDILSYCMKKDGFMMSIRSLSPRVIISDELGSKDDFEIVQYALKSGVNIITTAHGYDLEDIQRNIYLKNIIENNFFDRIVVLKNNQSPATVKQVYDTTKSKVIFDDSN